MQWRNSELRYGAISIALHWSAAASVIAMLLSAAWAWMAPNEDVAGDRLQLHGSIGALVWLLVAIRICWHFAERRPVPLATDRALSGLARPIHVAMLLLLAAQLVTGPVDIWSGGWGIGVFGWFSIPSPLGDSLSAWHDAIGVVHRYSGYGIALLVALHIAAALLHLLVYRDRTVQRMLGLNPMG